MCEATANKLQSFMFPCSASMLYSEKAGDSTAYKIFGSLLNALIFVVMVILVTVVFVCLYTYRCLKVCISC